MFDFHCIVIVNLLDTLNEIDEIIDIGAGLGHLSRILSLLFKFKVATVEGDDEVRINLNLKQIFS